MDREEKAWWVTMEGEKVPVAIANPALAAASLTVCGRIALQLMITKIFLIEAGEDPGLFSINLKWKGPVALLILFELLDGKLDCKKPTEHIADPEAYDMPSCVHNETSSAVERKSPSCKSEHQSEAEHDMQHLNDLINNAVGMCIESGEFPSTIPFPRALVKKFSQERRKLPIEVSKNLQYTVILHS